MRNPFATPKQTDGATPESSHGGPVYDARIDPLITSGEIIGSERLQQQRNLHLFDSKSAPAAAFSHAYQGSPAPLTVQIMGLAAQRDQIERIVSRKDWPPFPGVELGHVPAFAPSPSTNPITPPFGHLTHHAHLGPSRDHQASGRANRKRFGH